MAVANEGIFDSATGLNDLGHTITVNSDNAGLTAGTSQTYTTVTCGGESTSSSTSSPTSAPTSVSNTVHTS